ncbi:MAG TPA: AI-2E family transporter [Arenibaculum sp.]|nr:AI-2E family transporter [Arenibaculum sp.]
MTPLFGWLRRTFADPQVMTLALLLLFGFLVLALFGRMLAPVIASIVVAYLLEGAVGFLQRLKVPRMAAVVIVCLLFVSLLLGLFLILVPLLMSQVAQLAQQLPVIYVEAQEALLQLPEHYPELVSRQQIRELSDRLRTEVFGYGQALLVYSVAWLPTLVTLATYLVLMPMLVFFFLKDKQRILAWFLEFLPRDRPLVDRVWQDANNKFGGYVRGKAYEIAIVGIVAYLVFLAMGLQFSALLAAATGLSVLIPYIGALVAAVPVALAAYVQWGIGNELAWAMAVYWLIQSLDGFVLAPLLLAETADLHPNAIIVAILIFGGIWGFWGVFFAVPLASLVQAVLTSWPRRGAGFSEEYGVS